MPGNGPERDENAGPFVLQFVTLVGLGTRDVQLRLTTADSQ